MNVSNVVVRTIAVELDALLANCNDTEVLQIFFKELDMHKPRF